MCVCCSLTLSFFFLVTFSVVLCLYPLSLHDFTNTHEDVKSTNTHEDVGSSDEEFIDDDEEQRDKDAVSEEHILSQVGLFYYKDIKQEIVHTLQLEVHGVSKKWVFIMDRRQDSNAKRDFDSSRKWTFSSGSLLCQGFRRWRDKRRGNGEE